MRPEGVAAAAREIRRCTYAVRRLTTAPSLDVADEAWVDFLSHANRVYTKLRAASHGQGVDWMWWKRQMDERRDDQLLSYIHHARNCDTHRLEPMTEHIDAGEGLTNIPGIGQVYYGSAAHLRPLPVTDKRETYDPPSVHRGTEIAGADCGRIASLASEYLYALVSEAASRCR